MNHLAIIKDIEQKKFKPVYFLHGEESYFIDQITDAIIANALEEHERDFNQSIHYGKDAEVDILIAEAKGYPMMAERKVVILKEAQAMHASNFDKLEAYFSSPNEQTVFVVNYKHKKHDSRKKVFKSAASHGITFHSEKIKDWNIEKWIDDYVKTKNYGITQKARMLLAEFLGTDLSKIVNELDKLFILVEEGTTINDLHIEENIGISKDYNIFELVNAVGIRDIYKANVIIDYFYHNPKATSIIPVISNLFGHFSKLMRIHFSDAKTKEAIAANLRVAPFVAAKLMQSAKIYNPKKLASNIAILHEYDLKAKGVGSSGNISEGELMKEMIYRLMH